MAILIKIFYIVDLLKDIKLEILQVEVHKYLFRQLLKFFL